MNILASKQFHHEWTRDNKLILCTTLYTINGYDSNRDTCQSIMDKHTREKPGTRYAAEPQYMVRPIDNNGYSWEVVYNVAAVARARTEAEYRSIIYGGQRAAEDAQRHAARQDWSGIDPDTLAGTPGSVRPRRTPKADTGAPSTQVQQTQQEPRKLSFDEQLQRQANMREKDLRDLLRRVNGR